MDLPHFLKACRPIDIFGVETQENHARLCKHTYKYIIYIRYRYVISMSTSIYNYKFIYNIEFSFISKLAFGKQLTGMRVKERQR